MAGDAYDRPRHPLRWHRCAPLPAEFAVGLDPFNLSVAERYQLPRLSPIDTVADLHAVLLDHAGPELENILRHLVAAIMRTLTGRRFARLGILDDLDHLVPRVHPNHVQGNEGLIHPVTVFARD